MTLTQEPQRFTYKPGVHDTKIKDFRPGMTPCDTGDWVQYADYAALRAEVELKDKIIADDTADSMELVTALRAENERLRNEVAAARHGEGLSMDSVTDLTEQLAASQEQWANTNDQYESAAKAVTRLTVELAAKDAAIEGYEHRLEEAASMHLVTLNQLAAQAKRITELDEALKRWVMT